MAHEAERDAEIRTLFAECSWEETPLGAPAGWPAALATAWDICLHSRFPMIVFWGDDLTQLYNAAFVPILGTKHPAMGMRAADCWHEIWDQVGPMLRAVLERGEATYSEDFRLLIERAGDAPEECYFTFSYSPVLGEGERIEGVFCVVTETTRTVRSRRRMDTLNAIERVVRDAGNGRDAVAAAVRTLAASDDATAARAEITDPTQNETIVERAGDDAPLLVDDVLADETGTVGRLLLAPNPVCPLDDDYRSFCRLAARQLGAALARVFAREHERRRARELEELDRAKTTFFSSVSHEFRTPLTLMLGPLDDLVRTLPDFEQRRSAELARRNAIRLRKLVNTLLDFARAESGRQEMQVTAVELDELVEDIASEFRSAFAAVGLTLDVRTNRPGIVWVDRTMIEKIVMNLLANALKFTAAGGVRIETSESNGRYVLRVTDTGVGIAPDDLPHVFERFRRSAATMARSHEGSGIGLALVRELTRMHGGEITVESAVGVGSTFIVRLPLDIPRRSPAAPDAAAEARTYAAREEFLEEAAALARGADEPAAADEDPSRIVFADDNADLRAYVTRLLGARYRVEAVRDGVELLAAVERARPALVIADVMMPRLDGIGALRALRADPRTADLPFLLLSARAGDEAVAAGLGEGADDYIVKPFVASELLARAAALVRRRRHETERTVAGDTSHRREIELLAAVADRFIAAVDTEAVAQAVTDVLAGRFADWCVVYVPTDDGRLEAASVGHVEPAKAELGRMIERQYPRRIDDGSPAARAFASGTPVFVPHVNASTVTTIGLDPRHAELVSALGVTSLAAVPVMNAGRVVAVIAVASAESQRVLAEADLRVLQRFADRTALALENARLYERERTIAATLQRALLPGTLPVVDGLRFFASYSPASEESLIGGDWYDAFRAADGRIVVSIGDVVGHGLAAATVMATLRQAIRGFAVEDARPGPILEHLNRVLLAEGNERLATALVASIDPQTLDVRIASAGHYGPALVPGERGEPVYLDAPGILLGVDDAPVFPEQSHQLTPGDMLVFFTDGFIENDRDAIAGQQRFSAAARTASAASDPATAIHHAVFGGRASRDDAALLVVQPQPVLESLAFSIPGEPHSAGSARVAITRFLTGLGFDADRTIEVLTATGEAIINAIEHGYRAEAGTVRVTGTRLESAIEIEVQDFGGWREPAGPNTHRGFGLPLMHAFADAVDVERTPFGTRVLLRFGLRAAPAARV